MPKIEIHLNKAQYKKLKAILNYNGNTDLSNETYSGKEIILGLTPFGNTLEIKGYQSEDLGVVKVEFEEQE